jgi:hypothetical protein
MRTVPEVVPPAEDEVRLGVERGAYLPQPAVAAPTLETVLVPEAVQRFQQKPATPVKWKLGCNRG